MSLSPKRAKRDICCPSKREGKGDRSSVIQKNSWQAPHAPSIKRSVLNSGYSIRMKPVDQTSAEQWCRNDNHFFEILGYSQEASESQLLSCVLQPILFMQNGDTPPDHPVVHTFSQIEVNLEQLFCMLRVQQTLVPQVFELHRTNQC